MRQILGEGDLANGTFAVASGIQNVDALLAGTKWNSLSITYNFPNDLSYYPANYGGSFSIFSNPSSFQSATAAVRNTVAWAVQEQFSKVTNLTFTQVGATAAADTSIAGTDLPDFGGFGYFPIVPGSSTTAADLQRQGDYWYDSPQTARFANIVRGDNSWRGVMHEIGHTLGLKHGNETGGVTNTAMAADRDSMEFSVMTYRKFVGADPNGDSFADVEKYGAAQTLMMYDIAALQQLYGANYNTNSGNTVYTWSPTTGEMFVNGVGQGAAGANRIFMTLWDGNGVDTYDLSNYTTNLQIDLTPGGWSVLDPAQLALIGVAEGIKARGNVFNALTFNNDPRSLIEAAFGGSGNDTIKGNDANNTLKGGPGNDTIDGGAGTDTAIFSGNLAAYSLTTLGHGSVQVSGPDGTDTLLNVERFQFNDQTVNAPGSVKHSDFNGDGFSDVLWRDNSSGDTGYTDFHAGNAWHGLGASSTAYSVVGTGDFNGDGFGDALWRNNSSGDTGYTDFHGGNAWHGLGVSSTAYSIVGTGDFNGDGFSDILFRSAASGDTGYSDQHNANAWHGLGAASTAYSVVGTGDFNGDGFSDVLWRNNSSGDTGYSDLHGGNAWHGLGTSSTAYNVVGTGDFNGDGFADVLWRNNSSGDTGYTNVHGGNAWHGLGASSTAYSVVAVGDYSGDGFDDILYRNAASGDTGYADLHANTWHGLGAASTSYLVVA